VKSQRETAFVRTALLFYAAVLAVALLLAKGLGHSLLFASREAAAAGIDWRWDPLVGLAAAALAVAATAGLTAATGWGDRLARALAEILGPLSLRSCVLLAAVSGVAEEALFRGALQPSVGLWMASLLFGCAHLVPRRDLLPWTAFTFAAGICLGALYDATGNLVAPVIAHAGVNAVNLRVLSRRSLPAWLAVRRSRRSRPPRPGAGRPPAPSPGPAPGCR
jgi:membrane protease YdiL (CAAX protease family)